MDMELAPTVRDPCVSHVVIANFEKANQGYATSAILTQKLGLYGPNDHQNVFKAISSQKKNAEARYSKMSFSVTVEVKIGKKKSSAHSSSHSNETSHRLLQRLSGLQGREKGETKRNRGWRADIPNAISCRPPCLGRHVRM
jgi:hypothetical protein